MMLLEKQFPKVNAVYFSKEKSYQQSESDGWWQELEANAAAAVVAVSD